LGKVVSNLYETRLPAEGMAKAGLLYPARMTSVGRAKSVPIDFSKK